MTHDTVRRHRKRLGFSLVRLAARAAVSRYRLVQWELGDGPLTPDELERITRALRTAASERIVELQAVSTCAP